MTEGDLDAVLAVQAACYPPSMQEPADIVLARLRAARDSCLVACDGEGVCAYVFAYASRRGAVTPLDAAFQPAADADTLYIHDLAVAPRALGQGLARRLAGGLLEHGQSRGLTWSALVAVQDSRRFWEGLGFAVHGLASGGQGARALLSYPDGALYMALPAHFVVFCRQANPKLPRLR